MTSQPIRSNIVGVDESSVHTRGQVVLELWHRSLERPLTTSKFVILSYFHLDHPQQSFSHEMFPTIDRAELADPHYNMQGRIDGIIGVDVLSSQLTGGLRRNALGLLAQATQFGWIVFGGVTAGDSVDTLKSVNLITTGDLHAQIRRLWEIDEMAEPMVMSSEERECEALYENTVVRRQDRYAVTLLLKPNAELGDSKTMARRRLYCLENRFKRDPSLKASYVEFMEEFERLGHMRRANPLQPNTLHYYIPHHAVAVDRKFRVVFDGSAKSSNGKSINDLQYVGPRLQRDLVDIIMSFRTGQYAVTADICKMYRQVEVLPQQWDLQRILWRKSQTEPIAEYWITVVTYGLASSPYNAVKTLHQCAADNATGFPRAAEVAKSDFYMDDLLTSVETPTSVVLLKKEMIDLLRKGGFELAKWRSNCVDIMLEEVDPKTVSEQGSTSVLGIVWNYKDDDFQFKVQSRIQPEVITKRVMTSEAARIFDPQGLVTPITIRAKLFIQQLWRTGSDWDKPLTPELQSQWKNFYDEIKAIGRIKIPRWLDTASTKQSQIHLYCDASSKAYGAAAYVRVCTNGQWSAKLLCSKSRVAPIKVVTIPRLELCAVELGCNLLCKIRAIPMLKDAAVFLWTDSEIVLHWMRKPTHELKMFVANRVSRIRQAVTIEQSRHVRSEQNPADLLSRGVKADALIENTLWWSGPDALRENCESWPVWNPTVPDSEVNTQIDTEVKVLSVQFACGFMTIMVTGNDVQKEVALIDAKSSFREVCRLTAYVLRACARLYEPIRKKRGETLSLFKIYDTDGWKSQIVAEIQVEEKSFAISRPSIAEVENAANYWAVTSQKDSFPNEYKTIARGKNLSPSSSLWGLTPRMDQVGVLRIAGRLNNLPFADHVKHPIILDRRSKLAKRVALDSHTRLCHGGVQMCTQYLRNKYWIPGIRILLRSVVYHCKECALHRQNAGQQFMAELPAIRLQPTPAFQNTGVDYAGPIMLKYGRNSKVKGYIAVFVCMVYKAVHLELVSDMTSSAFIAALSRFVNLRAGRVRHMYSDNGTNFVGANRELKEAAEVWQQHEVMRHLENCSIQWHFNVPHAPHHGGLWEAAVKSTKHHLKRECGAYSYTFEELATLLSKIAACLNSRPLTPMSSDPTDLHALTPGHFLTGQPIVTPYEGYLGDQKMNRLDAWQRLQKLQQDFWDRWSQEYITEQQRRNKWAAPCREFRIGDLVFIKNETTPPCQWLLARIAKVFPGDDGRVRSCEVRVDEDRSYVRPITKLVLLPIEEPDEADMPNEPDTEEE